MAGIADALITLVIDDTQYTGKLQAAGKAIEDFGQKAKHASDTAGGGFDKLGLNVEGLKKKFELLQVAILGVGLMEFARSAMEYADKIEDMSKATGMTIPQIMEFQAAVRAAGGNAEGAAKGIQNFYAKIDEARQGSGQVQFAFQRLGISMTDLAKMSDQKIFQTAIQELAKLPPGAEQARLSTELLGKTFKGLSVQEVAEKLKEMNGKFNENGASVKAAAELNKKLEESFTQLKIAALEVFSPIIEALNKLTVNGKDSKKIIEGLTIAFGVFAGLKVAEMIIGIAEACWGLKKALDAVAVSEAAATGGLSALASFAIKLGLGVAGAYVLADATGAIGDNAEKSAKQTKELADEEAARKKQQEEQDNAVKKANAAQVTALQEQLKAFKELLKSGDDKIRQETSMIGLGADAIKREQARFAIVEQIRQKELEFQAKMKEAAARPGDTGAQNEANAAKKALEDLKKNEDALIASRMKAVDAQIAAEKADRDRIMTINDEIASKNKIKDIEYQQAQLGLGPLAKGYNDIYEAARKAAQAEVDAENARRGSKGKTPLSDEEVAAYFDRHKKLADNEAKALQTYNDQARSFNTGWKEAFNQYVDDATNAANAGRDIFNSVTSNMNSAIDKFVETGKFSFADFTKSILQDIMKIQLKMAAANVIKTSGIGQLFGFAEGGIIPTSGPVLVGEKGPELIEGAQGKRVIPNNELQTAMGGGQTHNTYITNNISAIDSKSVAQLFAENRMTLFGNVEQARRELPMRTR